MKFFAIILFYQFAYCTWDYKRFYFICIDCYVNVSFE